MQPPEVSILSDTPPAWCHWWRDKREETLLPGEGGRFCSRQQSWKWTRCPWVRLRPGSIGLIRSPMVDRWAELRAGVSILRQEREGKDHMLQIISKGSLLNAAYQTRWVWGGRGEAGVGKELHLIYMTTLGHLAQQSDRKLDDMMPLIHLTNPTLRHSW